MLFNFGGKKPASDTEYKVGQGTAVSNFYFYFFLRLEFPLTLIF